MYGTDDIILYIYGTDAASRTGVVGPRFYYHDISLIFVFTDAARRTGAVGPSL